LNDQMTEMAKADGVASFGAMREYKPQDGGHA